MIKPNLKSKNQQQQQQQQQQICPLYFECKKRAEHFSCDYRDVCMYSCEYSPTLLQSSCSPHRDWLGSHNPQPLLSSSYCPGVKNAFWCSFAETSLNLNHGIASRRKLNISTNRLLWYSKSCVFIHMILKKIPSSSCQWKV